MKGCEKSIISIAAWPPCTILSIIVTLNGDYWIMIMIMNIGL